MNRENIIRMAREADREWDCDRDMVEWLEWFAALVAAASASVEREACAKVADRYHVPMCDTAADAIANAIRARGQAIEQQPAAPDWSDVSKLIEAASRASSSGYLTGTTNWASAVIKHLGAKPAAQWVGLTKENINHYVESRPYYGYCNEEYREGIEEGAKWAEAQLREKNWGKA